MEHANAPPAYPGIHTSNPKPAPSRLVTLTLRQSGRTYNNGRGIRMHFGQTLRSATHMVAITISTTRAHVIKILVQRAEAQWAMVNPLESYYIALCMKIDGKWVDAPDEVAWQASSQWWAEGAQLSIDLATTRKLALEKTRCVVQ